MTAQYPDVGTRLMSRVREADESHPVLGTRCLIWTGYKISGRTRGAGYGQIRFNGKNTVVHRVMWMLHRGPIPEGMVILHKCDVRDCVNLEHLRLGTVAENNKDMAEKMRGTVGELASSAKLTKKKVVVLRELMDLGMDPESVAELFGVDRSTACMAHSGRSWRCVGPREHTRFGRPLILAATMAMLEQRASRTKTTDHTDGG